MYFTTGEVEFLGNVNNTGDIKLYIKALISAQITGNGTLYIQGVVPTPDNADLVSTVVSATGNITEDVAIDLDENGILQLLGGKATFNSNDNWKGTVLLDDDPDTQAGATMVFKDLTSNGSIISTTTGKLSIESSGAETIFTLKKGSLLNDELQLSIGQNTKLKLDNYLDDQDAMQVLTLSAGDTWNGTIELVGSSLKTTSDLVANSNFEFAFNNQLIGDEASIYENSGLNLVIRKDLSSFKGTYNQTEDANNQGGQVNPDGAPQANAGSLTVYMNNYGDNENNNGKVFAGTKNINSGTVTIYDGGTNYYNEKDKTAYYGGFVLGTDTQYTNYSAGGSVKSDIVKFADAGTGAVALFTNLTDSNASANAEYNLHAYTSTGENIISFRNSNVTLKDTDYSDKTNYTFGLNTLVNTQDNELKSYNFETLTLTDNAKFNIDIDMKKVVDGAKFPVPADDTADVVADTFKVGANSAGNFIISDINFKDFDINHSLGIIQILSGASDKISLVLDATYKANKTWAQQIKDDCLDAETDSYIVYNDTFLGIKGIREAKYEGSAVNDSVEIFIKEQKDVLNEISITETSKQRVFQFRAYPDVDNQDPDAPVTEYVYNMTQIRQS